jgi:hypothetical protein
VIRSTNLLSKPASEIFIHLAIKEIATIISLSFRSPTHRFCATRGDGLNSTGRTPDNAAPVLSIGFLAFFLNNWQSRKPRLFNAVASAKRPFQREVEVTKLLGAFRYNLEE